MSQPQPKLISPDHIYVDFKVDTPYFGCLPIDRFQRTRQEVDLIQETGTIRWNGWVFSIDKSRSVLYDATAGLMNSPHLRALAHYSCFVTLSQTPLRMQTDEERFGETANGFGFCDGCQTWYPRNRQHQHLSVEALEQLRQVA